MVCLSRKIGKIGTFLLVAVMMTACVDQSLYEKHDGEDAETKIPNSFDFSTVQKVKLNVDYSAFKTYGPVFFGVYTENPIITNEDAPDDSWNDNVTPIYEDYTKADGKFCEVVELPAYAQHLYIATGNFFTGMLLMEADVKNGAVSVVAENHQIASVRGLTRAEGPGVSTDDISKLNLTNIVNGSGKVTDEKIYNDWKNWLGTWNSASGRPDYLLNKATADPKLVISDKEMADLYATVSNAFVSSSAMNDEYSSYPDLLLTQDSEVTFTLLGGSTCWNSSLGYYYYTDDNKPTNPTDIHPIMLFPNTQDGQWARASQKLGAMRYKGNIGTERGDVVKLKYYPYIANNDKTDGTTVFPKGTRIGFVLKTQAWSMQGNDYSNDVSYGPQKFNCWCTTTEGLSFAKQVDKETLKKPIINGASRGAKYSYTAENGDTYTIISFEDAMDDLDYDDLIFALKPVGVFAPVPEIEDKKSSTTGVYAFEDLWPKKGDYDLNDVVVNAKHEKEFTKINKEYVITKETFYLTTYQNYVELTSGLALSLNTKGTLKSIAMKKIAPESTDIVDTSFEKDGDVYYLTNDVKGEIGTT